MYRLIWVTDLGYAGMAEREYRTVASAQADATAGVTWTRRGGEWVSSRSSYGDIFYVKPIGR